MLAPTLLEVAVVGFEASGLGLELLLRIARSTSYAPREAPNDAKYIIIIHLPGVATHSYAL
jgi:hypothetical protein